MEETLSRRKKAENLQEAIQRIEMGTCCGKYVARAYLQKYRQQNK